MSDDTLPEGIQSRQQLFAWMDDLGAKAKVRELTPRILMKLLGEPRPVDPKK